MTAYLAVRQRNCIDLLADGALYSPDGVVVAIGPKVFEVPRCRAAFMVRGPIEPGMALAAAVAAVGASSFEEFAFRAGSLLPDLRKIWRDGWDLLIVGLADGGRRPEIHFCPEGGDTLTLVTDEYWHAGPDPEPDTLAAVGFEPLGDVADFDPRAHGLPIMEAFRRTAAPLPGRPGSSFYGIGGLVTHTRIGCGGLTTRIIHEWPDVVGRRIDPFTCGGRIDTLRAVETIERETAAG
jgi:hypothetical protein